MRMQNNGDDKISNRAANWLRLILPVSCGRWFFVADMVDIFMIQQPDDPAGAATPGAVLEQRVMDVNTAKSETEWWAYHRITALEAENARLRPAPGSVYLLQISMGKLTVALREIADGRSNDPKTTALNALNSKVSAQEAATLKNKDTTNG